MVSSRFRPRTARRVVGATVAFLSVLLSGVSSPAIVIDLRGVGRLHGATGADLRIEQSALKAIALSDPDIAFDMAFEIGDEIFENPFNALDGVGANVGRGQRFTRVPRADLRGAGEWLQHTPPRMTGPNAERCNACHLVPNDDGAGGPAANVHRDPLRNGNLGQLIQRSTPHLFGLGALQRLAEEMTAELQAIQGRAIAQVCGGAPGARTSLPLRAKAVDFGAIAATRVSPRSSERQPCPAPQADRYFALDASGVRGVDRDLVIKPFQWKGTTRFVRDFNRDAAHNELGLQAVELVGSGVDGDFDGVSNEMTVGQQTALAVYLAAQPRPTTKLELDTLGLLTTPLTASEKQQILRGGARAMDPSLGCVGCHKPLLTLEDATFSEPSQQADFRDTRFPSGQDPIELGLDPAAAIRFDLTADQPDNVLPGRDGVSGTADDVHLGSLRKDRATGRALVELGGDLKRHDLGRSLAEPVDEKGTGASVFLTENLWGVGSTAPYLHDGRATTLAEAILEHGGEAQASRDAFARLRPQDQADVIAYLSNLVLFKVPEE